MVDAGQLIVAANTEQSRVKVCAYYCLTSNYLGHIHEILPFPGEVHRTIEGKGICKKCPDIYATVITLHPFPGEFKVKCSCNC